MADILDGRKLDITKIAADDLLTNADQSIAWVRGDVDEKIYAWGGKACVVIKFGSSCLATVSDLNADFAPAFMFIETAIEKPTLDPGVSTTTTPRRGSVAVERCAQKNLQMTSLLMLER